MILECRFCTAIIKCQWSWQHLQTFQVQQAGPLTCKSVHQCLSDINRQYAWALASFSSNIRCKAGAHPLGHVAVLVDAVRVLLPFLRLSLLAVTMMPDVCMATTIESYQISAYSLTGLADSTIELQWRLSFVVSQALNSSGWALRICWTLPEKS